MASFNSTFIYNSPIFPDTKFALHAAVAAFPFLPDLLAPLFFLVKREICMYT